MRVCLLIFFFLNSGLAAENDPAKSDQVEVANFQERFSGKEVCTIGKVCPKDPISADWGEQLTNIDLLKEMTKDLPPNKEPIVVLDQYFDPDMKAYMGDKFELKQKADEPRDPKDHGTGTAAIVHLVSPKSKVQFISANVTESVASLMGQVKSACKEDMIIASSVGMDPRTTFYDQDSKSYDALLKKGCIPVFAAGNHGGNMDETYLTVGALDRSGEMPDWSGKGRIAAAGDRVVTMGKNNGKGLACYADTYLAQGTSYTVEQVAGVLDMLKQILRQSITYVKKSPEERAKILIYIVNASAHSDGRMDAYRAGVFAKSIVMTKKWPTSSAEQAKALYKSIVDDHAAKRSVPFTTCATATSCSQRKICYDNKRRWLATTSGEASEVKKAQRDLFLTAHNAGDFEIAQNWAMKLEPTDMENSAAEWKEFRKRIEKLSDRTLVDEYLKSISGLMPIPNDVRSKRADAR